MNDNKKLMQQSIQFASDNLKQCIDELIEMKETGILKNGKVRELSELCKLWHGTINHIGMAESIIKDCAFEYISKL